MSMSPRPVVLAWAWIFTVATLAEPGAGRQDPDQTPHLPASSSTSAGTASTSTRREAAARRSDSTHEDTILSFGRREDGKFVERLVRVRESGQGRTVPPVQTMQTSPPKPPGDQERRQWEELRKQMSAPKIEAPFDRLPLPVQRLHLWARSNPKLAASSESYMGEEFRVLYEARRRSKHPLGDMPLISQRVHKGGRTPDPTLLATIKMTPEDWRRESESRSADLASLSSNSQWYVAMKSGHHIHLEDPELVVSAVRRVVEAARERKRL